MGTGSRYATSTTLSLASDQGHRPERRGRDGQPGPRGAATLADRTAAAPSAPTRLVTGGTDPSSPLADTVTDQACYSYQYVVLDTLGNATTYTSPDIKVDTTAPRGADPGLLGVHQHLLARLRHRPSTTARPRHRVRHRHRRGDRHRSRASRATRSRRSAPTGPRPRARSAVNTYSLVRRAGRPGHQARHGDQQRRPDLGHRAVHAHRRRHRADRRHGDLRHATPGEHLGQRELHDRHRCRFGRRDPPAATRLRAPDRHHLRDLRRLHDRLRRHQPASPFTDTVTGGETATSTSTSSPTTSATATPRPARNVVKVPVQCGAQLISNGGSRTARTRPRGPRAPPAWGHHHRPRPPAPGRRCSAVRAEYHRDLVAGGDHPGQLHATLSYSWKDHDSQGPGTPFDYFRVQVGGVTVGPEFSNVASGTVYVQRTLDLSAYAGQTITLTFLSDEDSSLQTSFWLDDVSLTPQPSPRRATSTRSTAPQD